MRAASPTLVRRARGMHRSRRARTRRSIPREQPPGTSCDRRDPRRRVRAQAAAIPFHTHASLLASGPSSALACIRRLVRRRSPRGILTLSGLFHARADRQVGPADRIGSGRRSRRVLARERPSCDAWRRRGIAKPPHALVGIATLRDRGSWRARDRARHRAAATQQLLAAGAIERRSVADRPSATVGLCRVAFVSAASP